MSILISCVVVCAKVVAKLQRRFHAAAYGTDLPTFFGRFDRDKGGSLDTDEFKRLVSIGAEKESVPPATSPSRLPVIPPTTGPCHLPPDSPSR